jgi:hypothetical protein
MRKGRKCPRCGSTNTAEILYGLPAFSEKLERDVNEGKLALGGCIVRSVPVNGVAVHCDPKRLCNVCGRVFGAPPLLIAKDYSSAEDYRDIVVEIRFKVGGFFQGWKELTVRKTKHGAHAEWSVIPDFRTGKRDLSQKEWESLLDDLYAKMYLHEWKKSFVDPHVMDGEQWELSIRLTGGRQRNYHGSNAYPPYWEALIKQFKPFMK